MPFVLAKDQACDCAKLDLALEIDQVLSSELILYFFLSHNLGSTLGVRVVHLLFSFGYPKS